MATVPVTATADSGLTILYGWSFTEAAVTPGPAEVKLRNGSGGPVVIHLKLTAGQSSHMSFANPLTFHDGAHVEVSPGTVVGMVDGS